jgi:hypothetical protein
MRNESRETRVDRIAIMPDGFATGISKCCVRRYLRQQYDFADISATLDMTMRSRSFRKRE